MAAAISVTCWLTCLLLEETLWIYLAACWASSDMSRLTCCKSPEDVIKAPGALTIWTKRHFIIPNVSVQESKT